MDKTSLLFWFPKIKDLGIPVPKTEILLVNEDFTKYIDNPKDFPKKILDEIKTTARKIGYPLFLRTDYLSGKHNIFKFVPYIEREEDLLNSVLLLAEETAMAWLIGFRALVFREYLKLDWKFKAFSGMPVARERRYFIKDGKILCCHPYWIEEAIKFWRTTKEPENWRDILKQLNTDEIGDKPILRNYAKRVADVLEGFWSIDFAYAKDGHWYLIDMAEGNKSWHPSDCPNCPNPEEMRLYEGKETEEDLIKLEDMKEKG